MKIIKEFNRDQIIDDTLLQDCLKGKRSHWKRTFLLENLAHGKVAFVSLNLFERIAWALENFFLHRNYSKFGTLFKTKNIKVLSPSHLEQTPKKVDGAKEPICQDPNPDSQEKDKSVPTLQQSIKTKEGVKDREERKQEAEKGVEEIEQEINTLFAEAYIVQQNNLKKAFEIVEKYPAHARGETKSKVLREYISLPISEEKLDRAIRLVGFLPYSEQRDINTKIALAYLELENLPQAFHVVRHYQVHKETKIGIYKAYATFLLGEEKLNSAFYVTYELSSLGGEPEYRNNNYCQIARGYFELNNYKEVFQVLSTITEREAATPLYKEFALSCFLEGKFTEAIQFYQKICSFQDTPRIAWSILVEIQEHLLELEGDNLKQKYNKFLLTLKKATQFFNNPPSLKNLIDGIVKDLEATCSDAESREEQEGLEEQQ